MSRKLFYDVPDGDTILYDIVDESNGFRLCTFGLSEDERFDQFKSIANVKCRDDDIFFNSYPKTGTNWCWEMITMMLNNTPNVSGGSKGTGMMEARPLSVLDDMASPRILNTHLRPQYVPKEAAEKKLKTILICRNPKDVAVSFFNHTKGIKLYQYDGKFENYLQMFMRGEVDYGSYPDYLRAWQEHIRNNPDVPFHLMYYEDLRENCVAELKKLRSFLGLEVDDSLLQQIAENCTINKMRTGKENAASPEMKEMLKTMLNPGFSMMRKGEIGDWKNWFSVAQSEMFDTWWEKETKGIDMFKFRYTSG